MVNERQFDIIETMDFTAMGDNVGATRAGSL